MTYNELCEQMVNDSSFPLKNRLKDIISRFSYDEVISAYNTATISMNVEDRDYDFTSTYEQLELVELVLLTTSLDRYEHAFGAAWVKSHLRHYSKDDVCITMRPDGSIETLKTYTSFDFITPIITYLTRDNINIFHGLNNLQLSIHSDVHHMLEEYAHLHGVDMNHLDIYTEEQKKFHAQMEAAYAVRDYEDYEEY